MDLMAEIAGDEVLDLAYAWLCRRRERTSHNNDVWDVRWRWADLKLCLRRQLLAGEYRLDPTRRVHCEQDVLEIWSALDALVLKATALVLGRYWHSRLSARCFHLAGRGGAKAAVRAVRDQLTPSGPQESPGPEDRLLRCWTPQRCSVSTHPGER
jgi:RNA-directed DNA polymerase